MGMGHKFSQPKLRPFPYNVYIHKANTYDTEAAFLDLHLSISNDIVFTKIYDKRDDFDFEIVNFAFFDGDVPRSTSYGVYTDPHFQRKMFQECNFN